MSLVLHFICCTITLKGIKYRYYLEYFTGKISLNYIIFILLHNQFYIINIIQ